MTASRGDLAPDPSSLASGLPVARALRRTLARGYGLGDLRADLLAGIVVGIVALPLSMALAIAVGVPPQHGLYTAIVAGASVALLGGCKFQVTGPTAALVVVLAPIAARHGLSGLLTAGLLAGLILIALGVARLGALIKYVPAPVTTGFTAGIATVIALLQVKDVLGLDAGPMPDSFTGKLARLWEARGSADVRELGVAASTFALLLLVPRLTKRIPAPLVALGLVAVAVALGEAWLGFSVDTIGTRFAGGIPRTLPSPSLPFGEGFSLGLVRELLPAALTIALLGAIESLLSAVIADGMTGTKHDPNSELVALGLGNVLAPLFGGIAATGALARTATNVRAGARSPFAAVFHALVVLLAVVLLAPLVAHVPMASLAALLLLVAWNMSELPHFLRTLRVAPRSDALVLVVCYALTVLFDMVVAVSAGFVLAAILFMRRMAEITESKLELDLTEERGRGELPRGVCLYEVNGPLFFGAAQKAMEALHASRADTFDVLVLHLGKVPAIDATGLHALEGALEALERRKKAVILAGPLPAPAGVFERARLTERFPSLLLARNLDEALAFARARVPSAPSRVLPDRPADPAVGASS